MLSRFQSRIVEIEAIKDLVIIISRSGRRFIGELHRVSSFEKKDGRTFGRKLRMQTRIVKRVVVVTENFHRLSPRTKRRFGFGIPQFAECGWAAERLHEDSHPTCPECVPCDGTAVRL